MNWTSEKPTKAGFYAWKNDELRVDEWPVKVSEFGPPDNLVARIDDKLELVSEIGGLWCRLVPESDVIDPYTEGVCKGGEIMTSFYKDYVPKEEVEKAWWEAIEHAGASEEEVDRWWVKSRAKRVMEGTEP